MKNIIETLYPMGIQLLGEGYDNALEFIKHLVPLEVIEIPSGTKLGTWTVPDEWIVHDAWVKNKAGEKIADYKKNPLSLMVGSTPQEKRIVSLDELRQHWFYSDELPDSIPYKFKFYDKSYRDWGFCFAKNEIKERNTEVMAGIKTEDGKDYIPEFKDKLIDDEYEIFVDTEERPGKLKIGVHTIKGKSDREILLFAHLDHPYQANDNLSGVACLLDIVKDIKCEHTIKIVFCPETIGSIGYALTQDISKVDFMISVDVCGNKESIVLQLPMDKDNRIGQVAHLALRHFGDSYRMGKFRNTIGSDEYVFNDPLIGIPGILLTRFPYPEYHTSADTPETIDYDKIKEVGKVILKTIDIYEKDFIPVRKFKGPLMRSRWNFQTANPQMNLSWDYFFYHMDGKKYLSELCIAYGIHFDTAYEIINKIKDDGYISINSGEVEKQSTTSKKHKGV